MLDMYLIHLETSSLLELHTTNMIKRKTLREEEEERVETSHNEGERVNKRGMKKWRGMGRGCAELVPVLERLRPRNMRSKLIEEGKVKRRRGRGGGRSGARGKGRGRKREAFLSLKDMGSGEDMGVTSVDGEVCDVVTSGGGDGDGKEKRIGDGLSEIEVADERSGEGTSERERREEGDGEERKDEGTSERGGEERGEGGRSEGGKWVDENRTSDRKDEETKEFQMPPGVPKLRRTHAKSTTLAMMLSGKINIKLDEDSNSSHVSDNTTDADMQEDFDVLAEKGKATCSKDHAVNGSSHDEQVVPPLLACSSLEVGPKTSEDTVTTLHSISKPKELSELTLLLTQPLPSSTLSDALTSVNITEPMMSSLMMSSSVPSLSQGRDDEEYPQPSTNYQKIQRHLARQKQLADMRSRETTLEREQRFLRRRGLLGQQGRNDNEHVCRRVRWKEESELLEVFCYSPCSSRGSTLDPDEIPDSTDPT